MTRRVSATGAGQDDRLAMIRVFDQREDLAFEAKLACGQNRRGVPIVGAVDDERARLDQMSFLQHSFVEIAVNDPMPLFMQAARVVFVFFDDNGCDAGLLQLGEQRRYRRTVIENDHVFLETRNFFR